MDENSLEVRNYQQLNEAFLEADNIIMKKYMNHITDYPVKKISAELDALNVNNTLRLYKVDRLVFDSEENNQDKLMNVYNSVAISGGSVINIVTSDGEHIDYYMGVKMSDINRIATCQATLSRTFEGNFPGSVLSLQKKKELNDCLDRIFVSENEDKAKIVSVVNGIPGLRDEDNKKNERFVQGIEKIIDSMKGCKYTLITVSDPICSNEILQIKEGYETLYSQLSPFAATSLTYSESESDAISETITKSFTKTVGTSIANTVSNSTSSSTGENSSNGLSVSPVGIGVTKNWGTSSSFTRQDGVSLGETSNESTSTGDSSGKTDTYTNTNGRTLQINVENKKVKSLMDQIDRQIKRIDTAADQGLWNTATYCIAEDTQTSIILANHVEAICRGKDDTVESFFVGTWDDRKKGGRVIEYLKKLSHPVLELEEKNFSLELNPTSLINGKELVIEAGLPQKSVMGLPVSEMASFARNIVSDIDNGENVIHLGNVFHMGKVENTSVDLDLQSLTAHTLITGSTGSGKSNTVYQMLSELKKHDVRFLIVEPAKGEYKNVFGNCSDVTVYGSNDNITELLKINPFSFPETIHVLEHIDRLIEIFNVCWPMYAAMPAVLKDAVLTAYESCGWDLENSYNMYGTDIYPTFKDLQRELVEVIDYSAYSDEVKGNYIGSLATRIKSLTNGLNGKMFTSNAIMDSRLFDENVIVDLSRIGSSETKSLIMGLLVMKLNEYRMGQAENRMNQKIKHITVLEEAHNLLKNVNAQSGEEGGNIAAKSVEMLTNSIAEMRTYGEGFIIVDQSPSAVDVSAVRNTNTKIIMRLPEEDDRRQAGKSAALKDNQIDELAKLNRGIAVVYQNNWLDPVLCQIEKADVEEKAYQYQSSGKQESKRYDDLLSMLMKNRIDEKIDYNIDVVERNIEDANISMKSKVLLNMAVKELKKGKEPELLKESSFRTLSGIVVELTDCADKLSKYAQYGEDFELLQGDLNRVIERYTLETSKELKLAISQCIMHEIVEKDRQQIELYAKWREYAVEQKRLV